MQPGWEARNKESSMTMNTLSDHRQEVVREEVNRRRKPERREKANLNEGSKTII